MAKVAADYSRVRDMAPPAAPAPAPVAPAAASSTATSSRSAASASRVVVEDVTDEPMDAASLGHQGSSRVVSPRVSVRVFYFDFFSFCASGVGSGWQ